MRRFKGILIILLFAANIQAQYSAASFAIGIGTYQLSDLKLFQDELIAIAPVAVKGFTYFPAFTHIRSEVFRKTRMGMKYGLSYSFSTTGAHANYRDYSGVININQEVTAHQLGAAIYYPLYSKEYFELLPFGRIMFGYASSLVRREISTLYEQQNIGVKMRAFSPSAEVGLEAIYHLKVYSFAIEGGYQYDVGGNLKVSDNDSQAAGMILPDRQVRLNMSGLRIAAKIVLRFNFEPFNE